MLNLEFTLNLRENMYYIIFEKLRKKWRKGYERGATEKKVKRVLKKKFIENKSKGVQYSIFRES